MFLNLTCCSFSELHTKARVHVEEVPKDLEEQVEELHTHVSAACVWTFNVCLCLVSVFFFKDRLHVTSLPPCWRTITKDSSLASIVSSSNMAATSLSFDSLWIDCKPSIYYHSTNALAGWCLSGVCLLFFFYISYLYHDGYKQTGWLVSGLIVQWCYSGHCCQTFNPDRNYLGHEG